MWISLGFKKGKNKKGARGSFFKIVFISKIYFRLSAFRCDTCEAIANLIFGYSMYGTLNSWQVFLIILLIAG